MALQCDSSAGVPLHLCVQESRQCSNDVRDIWAVSSRKGPLNKHTMCRFRPSSTCLTLILLFMTTPTFANSVDPDQMASEESGSTLFVIQFVNLKENII